MTKAKQVRLSVLALHDRGTIITAHHVCQYERSLSMDHVAVYLNTMMKNGEIDHAGFEPSPYGYKPLNVYVLRDEGLLLEKVRNG